MTDWLIGQVQAAATGQTPSPQLSAAGDQATNQLQGAIEQIGRAMRLAWLGRQPGAAAPDMFRAWAPEIALDNPVSGNAFDVRVLLTRTQVNQLYTLLKLIYDTASSSLDEDPGLFFERLQSVVARASTTEPSCRAWTRQPRSISNRARSTIWATCSTTISSTCRSARA